jgi:chromosome segregation ATPase
MTEAQMKAKVKEIDKQRRDLQKQISAIEKVYYKKERQLDSERDKATDTLEAKDSKLDDIESDLEEKIEVIETDRNFETIWFQLNQRKMTAKEFSDFLAGAGKK